MLNGGFGLGYCPEQEEYIFDSSSFLSGGAVKDSNEISMTKTKTMKFNSILVDVQKNLNLSPLTLIIVYVSPSSDSAHSSHLH